jgi:hypothetical protein
MRATEKNIGLIDVDGKLSEFPLERGYFLKKILVPENVKIDFVKHQYPQTEIVSDTESIIGDSSIELVMVSGSAQNNIELFAEILKAGKNLRVV